MTDTQVAEPQKPAKKKLKWWYPAKGARHYDGGRGKWISTYYRKFKRPTISLRISPASYFDNRLMIHIDLMWISWYIHLPVYSTIDECEYPEFGFYYHSNALVLCWNMKKKFIHMPWYYTWVRTSKYKKDGTWSTEVAGQWKKWKRDNPDYTLAELWKAQETDESELYTETHHYKYTTKYGVVQDDIDATIGVSEMEWRPRWFKWTKLFSKIRKSIEVDFSNEVGSERGSYKGGTVGCGYTMLPGETPYQTLMRMQKERSFDR